MPNTEAEWENIAQRFNDQWNFPNCAGSIDGKHVVIEAPSNSGSMFYNYKGTHSIVLMALADADYKFTYIDVGCNGRISDGGVFNRCSLSKALEENTLHIPRPKPLPNRNKPVPFVVVADDAFALKPYMLKPYPFRDLVGVQRIFNYRLSRARRVVENAFGILSARFRVLRKPIALKPINTKKVVLAICALHNFIMSRNTSRAIYAPAGTFDRENDEGAWIEGSWRRQTQGENLIPLQRTQTNAMNEAKLIREEFENYFVTDGEIPWQYKYI